MIGKLCLGYKSPPEPGGKGLLRKQKALLSWLLPQLGFQDSGVLK